jgi:cell fate regulator YaaT (PSP1 superfamily)
MKPYIVGIRFQKVGKVYHFDASKFRDLKIGDFAVVDTSRGRQLGEIANIVEGQEPPHRGTWKPIHNKATPRDLVMRQIWRKKEVEALVNCREKITEFGNLGLKVVSAEFTFDGKRLTFLYSNEGDKKVDLRKVRSAMKSLYPNSRIEMRQVGPRDVAKILGGLGACGLENRCCSMFLTEFSPISIRMAKEQSISLAPSEITGMCGRLRCCLVYEYKQYVDARKKLPKRKKRVNTPFGEGRVVDIYPLKESVIVELDNGTQYEFLQSEIEPWEEFEVLRKKSQEPCQNQNSKEGGCGKMVDNAHQKSERRNSIKRKRGGKK